MTTPRVPIFPSPSSTQKTDEAYAMELAAHELRRARGIKGPVSRADVVQAQADTLASYNATLPGRRSTKRPAETMAVAPTVVANLSAPRRRRPPQARRFFPAPQPTKTAPPRTTTQVALDGMRRTDFGGTRFFHAFSQMHRVRVDVFRWPGMSQRQLPAQVSLANLQGGEVHGPYYRGQGTAFLAQLPKNVTGLDPASPRYQGSEHFVLLTPNGPDTFAVTELDGAGNNCWANGLQRVFPHLVQDPVTLRHAIADWYSADADRRRLLTDDQALGDAMLQADLVAKAVWG